MPPLVDNPNSLNKTSYHAYDGHLALSSQVTPSAINITSPTANTAPIPGVAQPLSKPDPADPTHHMPVASSSSSSSAGAKAASARRSRSKPRPRRDEGRIPRPPNAFILFRSAFIRSQHIPDRVEGNHSNLSKIIGRYWKTLPPEERAEWEAKAQEAAQEHREKYPDWRFRPGPYEMGGKPKTRETGGASSSSGRRNTVSNAKDPPDDPESSSSSPVDTKEHPEGTSGSKSKGKGKGKEKESVGAAKARTILEQRNSRCDKIATLLVEGKSGAELANAVEEWEEGNKRRNSVLGKEVNTSSPGPSPTSLGSYTPTSSPISGQPPSSSTSNLGDTPDPRPQPLSASSSFAGPHHHSQHQLPSPTQHYDSTARSAPIKGISSVPLTQMFTSPSSATPSIAELCPPSPSTSPRSSGYPKPSGWGQGDIEPSPPSTFHRSSPTGDQFWWDNSSATPNPSSTLSFDDKTLPPARSGADLKHENLADLGYERTSTMDDWSNRFEKGAYGSLNDLPSDGSDTVTGWTTTSSDGANRHGLCATIQDPCLMEGEGLEGEHSPSFPGSSPPTALSHTHALPSTPMMALTVSPSNNRVLPSHTHRSSLSANSSAGPSAIGAPPSTAAPGAPFLYHPQSQPQAHVQPQFAATSYSTLTGWAGELSYHPPHQQHQPSPLHLHQPHPHPQHHHQQPQHHPHQPLSMVSKGHVPPLPTSNPPARASFSTPLSEWHTQPQPQVRDPWNNNNSHMHPHPSGHRMEIGLARNAEEWDTVEAGVRGLGGMHQGGS
ncbi:specific transcriptional repressor [Coprinopsis cinerea AmutBmut pab1-1]|nr:specific transcriptional repressor [Coprinopsis cinerea AmutBmut pab1-1]